MKNSLKTTMDIVMILAIIFMVPGMKVGTDEAVSYWFHLAGSTVKTESVIVSDKESVTEGKNINSTILQDIFDSM